MAVSWEAVLQDACVRLEAYLNMERHVVLAIQCATERSHATLSTLHAFGMTTVLVQMACSHVAVQLEWLHDFRAQLPS